MSDTPGDESIHDDPAKSRLVLEKDGATAELIYETEPGRLIFSHTEVPDLLGGRGIGGQLIRAGVNRARADDLTVVPWCPFARRWLNNHPDATADVSIDWETPPPPP